MPLIWTIFEDIKIYTSFEDVNIYLNDNSKNSVRLNEPEWLFQYHDDEEKYRICAKVISEGKNGFFMGFEKNEQLPSIFTEFAYRIKNGEAFKHLIPLFIEDNTFRFNPKNYISEILNQIREGTFNFFYDEKLYLKKEVDIAEPLIEKLQRNHASFEKRAPLFDLCKKAFEELYVLNINSESPVNVDREYRIFLREVNEDPERKTLKQKLNL